MFSKSEAKLSEAKLSEAKRTIFDVMITELLQLIMMKYKKIVDDKLIKCCKQIKSFIVELN